MELWKPVPIAGFERFYSVSNLGRVRRDVSGVSTRAGRVLEGSADPYGYTQVRLRGGDAPSRTFKVHRLVALAFLRPPKNGEVVNHIDYRRDNNCVENLEWTDKAGNTDHSRERLARGSRCGSSKLTESQVDEARQLLAQGATQDEVGARFGVSQTTVGRIARGETWVSQ